MNNEAFMGAKQKNRIDAACRPLGLIPRHGRASVFPPLVESGWFLWRGPFFPALAPNVADGCHPSRMLKTLGGDGGAALYVMPDVFAQKIPSSELVRFIWPEDGAIASPVTLLVKKKAAARWEELTDYLAGKTMARIFNRAHFPAPHASPKTRLAADAWLKWLGWDYIHGQDIGRIISMIDKIFLPALERNRCGTRRKRSIEGGVRA